MKLASFVRDGRAGWGPVEGDRVRDLSGTTHATLRAALEAGALPMLATASGPQHALSEVTLLPVVPDAGKILCIGTNYAKRHPLGGETSPPDHPQIFVKLADALVGHGGTLVRPDVSGQLDYEGEIAVVIGKAGRAIDAADAMAHVAGFTCFNDGSVRDYQAHSVAAGKNFFASGACGPWMTTSDEIGDASGLRLVARLNGVEKQRTTADRMFFALPALIAYLSSVTPLAPGDIIATGSPAGTGATQTPPRFLQAGDLVEIEVQGVGTLSNRVG